MHEYRSGVKTLGLTSKTITENAIRLKFAVRNAIPKRKAVTHELRPYLNAKPKTSKPQIEFHKR